MSADRAKDYFKNSLVREDYYTRDREIAGVWGGSLAKELGLEGDVDQERYFQMVDNVNPATGKQMNPRMDENRRIGFDFTFSGPKGLSLIQGLQGSPEMADAHHQAVWDTLKEMEQEMQVRISSDRKYDARDTGNFLYAAFTHWTSRPVEGKGSDPHLHTHVVIFNTTWDPEEERFKAGEFNKLVSRRAYWEAVYHNKLALNVQALGYQTGRDVKSAFELKGIDRPLIEKFSRRTVQIEEVARQKGIVDPKKKAELGAKTRAGKPQGWSVADHQTSWWERLTPEERQAVAQVEANRFLGEEEAGDGRPPAAAVAYAVDECFERNSVVERHQFLTSMLKVGVGRFSQEQAEAELARAAADGRILAFEDGGEIRITTEEVLAEERKMIAFARDTQGMWQPLGRTDIALPESRDGRERPADWEAAAKKMLSSRDQVIFMTGYTGAGKTSVMQTVADSLERDGKAMFAFAPAAIASRERQVQAGFEHAETLATLFVNPVLQEQVRGQVLWLDEAGTAGARETLQMMELADRLNCRVIMTGDPNQHKPVTRGDALRVLEEFAEIDPVRLTEIRRQTREDYREVAVALNEGRLRQGFQKLEEMDAFREIEDPELRYAEVASDYADYKEKGKTIAVVAPVHYEKNLVNHAIREELKQRGRIEADTERTFKHWVSKGFQRSQKGDADFFTIGDKVKFHRAAKNFQSGSTGTVAEISEGTVWVEKGEGDWERLPLENADRFELFDEGEIRFAVGDELMITKNGQAKSRNPNGRPHLLSNGKKYEVAGFTAEGDIRLKNGFIVAGDSFYTFDYGFGTTSHRSQATDEDVTLIAESEASFSAASMEQWLVSTTRGKEDVRIYTDDLEGLRSAVERSAERLSATELLRSAARGSSHPDPATDPHRIRDWALRLYQWWYRAQEPKRESQVGEHTPAERSRESKRGVPGSERGL